MSCFKTVWQVAQSFVVVWKCSSIQLCVERRDKIVHICASQYPTPKFSENHSGGGGSFLGSLGMLYIFYKIPKNETPGRFHLKN